MTGWWNPLGKSSCSTSFPHHSHYHVNNLLFPTMGNWARANWFKEQQPFLQTVQNTPWTPFPQSHFVSQVVQDFLGARSSSGQGKRGLCVCYTRATEGKVPSPPSPCPGTATMPGKGQVTIWGGRFKDNQHSWLIINFMAREEGRWSLSTLINACSKSTLPSLPDVCFTKAKSCCCY